MRASVTRLVLAIAAASLLAGSLSAQTYRLGSIADVRFGEGWTLNGLAMPNTRAKLLNPVNFGSSGVVRFPIAITDTFATAGSVTVGDLASFDVFFIGWFLDSGANAFTAAELDAFKTWVSGGGTLIVTCDDPGHDAVCESFGFPVVWGAQSPAVPNAGFANHPLFSGPFGSVSQVNLSGNISHFLVTLGASIVGVDSDVAPSPVILVREFGAGRAIFFSDVDMIAEAVSAGDTITSDNDRYLGNLFAFAFAPYDRMIDAAAHTTGVNNTLWRSDVDLLNLGGADASVNLARFRKNQANLNPLVAPVAVPSGRTTRVADILGGLLPASNAGIGVSFPGGAILANSRFYNVGSPDGSVYGMYVPSIPASGAVGHGFVGAFHHLSYSTSDASGARVNIGFLNRSPFPVNTLTTLYGDGGEYLGNWAQTLQPFEHRQLTKIHQMVGTGAVTHGSAIVDVLTQGGEVDAYAMLIENISGDPIFMPAELVDASTLPVVVLAAPDPAGAAVMATGAAAPGLAPASGACSGDYNEIVAAAAHTGGVNLTTWKTDVDLDNPWGTEASVDIAQLKKNQANLTPTTINVTVPAGQTLRLTDILGAYLPTANAGLGIRYCQGQALANARFYNTGSGGGKVFGMYVPGERPEQAISSCVPGAFHHLSYSPNTSVGQRVNIGATSDSAFAVDWEIRMYGDDGSLLGTYPHTLQPFEHRQFTNIFELIGAPAVTHGWAEVEVKTPGGVIFPYVMLIENIGGDPIFMPAVPMPAATFPRTAALFEGTWTGEWVNATYGTSGPASVVLDFDLDRQVLNVTLDLDGSVFGLGDPPPFSFAVPLTNKDLEFAGSFPYGSWSFSLSRSCNITGNLTPAGIGALFVSSVDFTGSASDTRMVINYTVTFPGGGGTANGTLTLEKVVPI